jgi:23S rRNA (adenine2030-N6)-methyltransferase
MNYRHAFHAGNFADLVKHAAVLLALREMAAGREPLTAIDTHGGAGAYDLRGDMAQRSGEAEAGIGRLLAEPNPPEGLALLKAAVEGFNGGEVSLYPGSPVLIARALRKGDRLVTCELHPDDHVSLSRTLASFPNAKALKADGYATALEQAPPRAPLLVLIDPPFERPDDYDQAARTLSAIVRRNRAACVMVWLPLKDLETFDAFLRDLGPEAKGALVAEVRLRPLVDPMKMNGCALVIADPPPSLGAPLEAACRWVAEAVGENGGSARVWRIGS